MTEDQHTQSGRGGSAESNTPPGTRTTRRSFVRAAGAGALAAGIGTGAWASGASAQSDAFLQTDGTDFTLNGQPIAMHGSNNFWLMDTYFGTPSLHDTVFSLYDRLGLNFVRTWGFRDGTSSDGPMLQPNPGEYNEEAFQRFDSLVAKAGEYGIKLVLPLVNNWSEYGGKGQYVSWVDSASNNDDFYTNEECKQLYKDYVSYVLQRENTITGVEYRNDPAIGIWELANEPRASSKSVSQMTSWVEEMSQHIKSLTDNQLVSTGSEGFYTDGQHGNSYPWRAGEGVDYVAHHQVDSIDCCSYHMYPNAWNLGASNGSDWISQHHVDARDTIGKPAYLGEFGLSTETFSISQRNTHFQNWYDTLHQEDAAGAMIWQIVDGSRSSPPRLDSPTHGIYEDDTEALSIIQDYGSRARSRSSTSLEPNAPAAPTGVAVTGRTDTTMNVGWNATVGWGPGADQYAVTVDGSEVATVPAGTTSTTVTGLSPATSYEVAVRAIDVNGTRSAPSQTATLSTLPSNTTTVTDPCSDTSNLASASDTGTLTTDTSNASYFVRPDGSTDGARINRSAQEDAAMVYTVDGQLLDIAVEFHQNTNQGGDVEYYESTDGGATWQQVQFTRTVHSGPGGGGWSNELHTRAGFSAGADRVRIVLTGGSAAWSPQIGNVELVVGSGGTSTPTPTDTATPTDTCDGPRAPAWSDGTEPMDVDGDGVYEDMNENCEFDSDDVVTYFQEIDRDGIQNNPSYYDANNNGNADFDDIVTLFQQL